MRLIECDKCGKASPAPADPEQYETTVRTPGSEKHYDLCDACLRRLEAWINAPDPMAG